MPNCHANPAGQPKAALYTVYSKGALHAAQLYSIVIQHDKTLLKKASPQTPRHALCISRIRNTGAYGPRLR
jgi:hypothetical protein